MALTPEDVVNKRFNPTKFREGYDQDEVDDFLDEVVVELRRLNQENEELRQRLVQSDSRLSELSSGAALAGAGAPTVVPEPAAAAVAAPGQPFAPQASEPSAIDAGNTNNLLQLARRLHEEHVREGMEKRDALIAEGHATAARLVSESEQAQRAAVEAAEQARAAAVAADEERAAAAAAADQERAAAAAEAEKQRVAAAAEAEKEHREKLAALLQERRGLERQVDELRTFEREYREKLKGYIEGQLRELESVATVTNDAPATEAATAPEGEAPAGRESAQSEGAQSEREAQGQAPAGAQFQQPVATSAPQAAYRGPQPSDASAFPQPAQQPGFAGN